MKMKEYSKIRLSPAVSVPRLQLGLLDALVSNSNRLLVVLCVPHQRSKLVLGVVNLGDWSCIATRFKRFHSLGSILSLATLCLRRRVGRRVLNCCILLGSIYLPWIDFDRTITGLRNVPLTSIVTLIKDYAVFRANHDRNTLFNPVFRRNNH